MDQNLNKKGLQHSVDSNGAKKNAKFSSYLESVLQSLNADSRRFNDAGRFVLETEQNLIKIKNRLDQMAANNVPTEELNRYQYDMSLAEQNYNSFKNVVTSLTPKIWTALNDILAACNNNLHVITEKVFKWKHEQKVAQYGGPDVTELLKPIADECKELMNGITACMGHLKSLTPMLNKVIPKDRIEYLQSSFTSLVQQVLNTSFLMVDQPLMLVKSRLTVRVGLLILDTSTLASVPLKTECRIITEDTAIAMKQNKGNTGVDIETVGTIDGAKVKQKDLVQFTEGYLGFEFRNVKIKVTSRKTNARDGEAVKTKYYFLFTSNYTVFGRPFKICVLSFPFMVSVHGSQDPYLMPKAFWDTAFSSSPGEVPMRGPTAVPWNELGAALAKLFLHIAKCARGLNDQDIEHLKNRLFNGKPPVMNPMITWDKFTNEKLYLIPSTSSVLLDCSLWIWFFRIADMVSEKSGHETKVKALWDAGLIEGFVTKQMAEQKLLSCTEPTFLLRFSDNHLGSISAVVFQEKSSVVHLKPFKSKEEVEKFSLPAIILQCEQLETVNTIYKDKPKSSLEAYLPKDKKPTSPGMYEGFYSNFTIKIMSNINVRDINRQNSDNPASSFRKTSNQTSPHQNDRPYSTSSFNSASSFDSSDTNPNSSQEFSPGIVDPNLIPHPSFPLTPSDAYIPNMDTVSPHLPNYLPVADTDTNAPNDQFVYDKYIDEILQRGMDVVDENDLDIQFLDNIEFVDNINLDDVMDVLNSTATTT